MQKIEPRSTFQFFQKFPVEEAARKFFQIRRWRNEPVCGHRGSVSVTECKNHMPLAYRCKDCRAHFSVCTGTVLVESRPAPAEMADGCRHALQRPQRHPYNPDGPRTMDHPEVRLVPCSTYPRNLAENP